MTDGKIKAKVNEFCFSTNCLLIKILNKFIDKHGIEKLRELKEHFEAVAE